MNLSLKIRKYSGIIKIGLLLLFCATTIFNVIFHDFHGLNFPRKASAGNYRHHSDDHLKPFDHIILTWAGNPATTQAVTWRSHVDDPKPVAEIAPAKASPNFVKNARKVMAVTSPVKINGNFIYYHSVNFTGLNPNTLYAYRVGNGDIWSEWFQFRTAGVGIQPFTFLYLGDAQNNISSLWSRTIRAAVLYSPGARFMIHSGDLVHHKNDAREWDEWFNAGDWIFASLPSLPATGNHEYKKKSGGRRTLSRFWQPQFMLPENNIPGLEETYYHLDYQGTRFVVLNSNKNIELQARWLEGVLGSNPNLWTVVVNHHPVYSSVRGRDNKTVRRLWQPLFQKYKVDLVLQGHDHVYSRGHGPGRETGPVYVTSVSGPKMYKLSRAEWMDRAGGNMQLFQVISISRTVLNFKSITVTGEVYDAFDLVKEDGNSSILINRITIE
jgi:Purple acid Phosphatase, N-terminal domain/Calcineurin-like phosphoesterase